MCACSQEGKSYLVLYQKNLGQQLKGDDCTIQLHFGETLSGVLCLALESSAQEYMDLTDQAQRRVTKAVRELKHFSYEERLR